MLKYKLIFDLEMTERENIAFFNEKYIPTNVKFCEIIEIGAILLDSNNKYIGEFKSYVHPEITELTYRIMELTGIEYTDLDNARTLKNVLNDLVVFVKSKIDNENTFEDIYTYGWSKTDKVQMLEEMSRKNIKNDSIIKMLNNYVDIQVMVKTITGERLGLKKAIDKLGITFEGNEHDALYDAVNASKVLIEAEKECINKNIKIKR